MSTDSQAKRRVPAEKAYRRSSGAPSPAVEQDRAAGGRRKRWVALDDGRQARGSVTLRLYAHSRRIRAYLHWSDGGQTHERYICEVDHATRRANLVQAWKQARAMGILVEDELPAHSTASSADVRASMQGNTSKNTSPEMALRSLLFQAGLRYRVDTRPVADLNRKADVVFTRDRVAVFIDGCFWHKCPDHYRASSANSDFWRKKIDGNVARDQETNHLLTEAGWEVVRVWEHENPTAAAATICELLATRRTLETR